MPKVKLPLAALALLFLVPPACIAPRPVIATPVDRSAVSPSGDVPISVSYGVTVGPAAIVRVTLLTGSDAPPARLVDLGSRLTFTPTGVTGALTSADLAEGRSTLFVSLDTDGDGRAEATASSSFSYEPSIDVSTADRCDFLDPANCLFPFPNDRFTAPDAVTDTGRRVAFALDSMPRNVTDTPVDPTEWNRNDGWSPGSALLTIVPHVDLAQTGAAPITDIARSLDAGAPILVLDAASKERQLAFAELDAQADPGSEPVLFIRPAKNFLEGGRYVAVLRNLRDSTGAVLQPSRAFRIYRDRIATFVPEIEARRAHMEELFAIAAAAGVPRDDLFLIWDFTIASERNLSERMLKIRDEAFASLAGGTPSFTVTQVEEFAKDASIPGKPVDARIFRRVQGTFSVPLYLTGDGGTGEVLTQGLDGLPVRNGDYQAKFICNIPQSASAQGLDPVTPARGGVYGHGLLGARDEVNAGNVKDMSNEHDFMFCATDWIGMAEEDQIPTVLDIIIDFSKFPTLPDRVQQAMLNIQFLARLIKDPRGFATNPAFQGGAAGTPLFAPGEVYYDGNSQGGIIGGAATAVSTEWTRAVLGVPGMNYSTLLQRSVDFDPFLSILATTYELEVDRVLGLSLIQMLWDRAEANGYAQHMTTDPLPNTPAHEVLMHVAFGDHQVANVTAEIEARTIGARLRVPAVAPGRHSDVVPYFGIEPIPAFPFDGSAIVVWDSGPPTPPTQNLPPRAGNDPHSRPRATPAARVQKSEFLKTGGAVVEVCGSAPCLAP